MKRQFCMWMMATLLATSTVHAQGVDEAVVTARELAKEAVVELREGSAAVAEEKLRRAYELVRAPSIAYFLGQALEKQDKLVEASELYLQATRLDIDKGDAAGQRQAQERAAKARAALLPRIPRLVVGVEGVEPARVSVKVNGKTLPTAMVGASRLVDPGEVAIEGRVGDIVEKDRVSIAEGQEKSVVLRFENVPKARSKGSATKEAKTLAGKEPAADRAPRSPLYLVGWGGVGLGVVGLAAGGVFLGLAASKRSDRDQAADQCLQTTPLRCTEDQKSEIRGLEEDEAAAKTVAVASFAAGGVLTAAGVTLVVLSPRKRAGPHAAIEPWVGFGNAGIRGRF
ncbi:MAG: hypothetical protein JW751_03915 [Polyangiaceae bacterium]|nr:hypothetical protein [Polyangiaceae bacterium]